MKRNFYTAISVAFFVLTGNPFASAIEVRFAGRVTRVAPALSSEFSIGEIVTGRATLSPSFNSPTHTSYLFNDFTGDIGGDYPITSNGGGFSILNDFGGSIDSVGLGITLPAHQLSAPHVLGHVPDYFSLNILYWDNELTSTDLLEQFSKKSMGNIMVLVSHIS